MTNTEKRIDFLNMVSLLLAYAEYKGYDIFIFDFHRTPQQQRARFDKELSLCDGYRRKSKHQYWLAIDIVLFMYGKCQWTLRTVYEDLANYWKQIGGKWGGDWREEVPFDDIYHFEYGD